MSGPDREARAGGLDYRTAGVDIDEADRALDRIRPLVASTRRPEVLSDVGSFGGLFRLNTAGFERPVLVASTDGVGTKLRVARDAGRHEVPATTWSPTASTTSSSRAPNRSSSSTTWPWAGSTPASPRG